MTLMRTLAMLLVATALVACEAPVGAIYPQTASARLFVRSYEPGHDELTEVRALSPDQIGRLRGALHAQAPELFTAACFVPHHFFRMYDAKGMMIGEIAVCFCCRGVRARPALPMPLGTDLGADYESLALLVRELGSTPKVDCEPDEAQGL